MMGFFRAAKEPIKLKDKATELSEQFRTEPD
jgi:hypothetical protein